VFTIDTNILIAYLGGEMVIVDRIKEWRRQSSVLFVSSVTECELLSYPKLSHTEEEKIEHLLKEQCIAVPFDGGRARTAAAIRRTIPSLKLPDAAIAALALDMKTPLVTRNTRDFKKIPELQLFAL
jgi:predicted nucleic acid-binding protein